MKKSKIQVLLVVLICIVLVFTGCGKKEEPKEEPAVASGEKVLKLALVTPLTGESAKAGTEIIDAATMALEEAGYKAGDYKIEPIIVDVTTDPEKGALALEQAIINDGAQAVIFGWNSSVVMSLMDVVAKYKIPYYFDHAAEAGTIDDKYKSDPERYSYFIGKGTPSPELLAATSYISAIDEAIKDGTFKPANQNIAIYGEDTAWGRSFGSAVGNSFIEAGWTKSYEDYFPMDTTDFYAILSKIKASNPSIVAGTISSPASAAAFLKQAQALNLNAVIIADVLSANADYYSLTGDSVNYVLDSRPVWKDKGKAFVNAFQKKYGYAPSPINAGLVYDYMNFFIKSSEAAIDKYGKLDSESLYKFGQEVLMKGDFTYDDGIVMDRYKFTPDTAPSPVVGEGFYNFPVLQFMGPNINVIWPSSQATAKFQLPVK
ncbi:MAG: ABC transporter substrate-binding protein [Bacillota bacterium]